jgi:tetratricopeptide (TPR) repeat protein
MLSRSLDTAVVVHDGVSVFAPSNGTAIYGISNADGAELWQIGHDEGSMFRYVAGVWNQLAVLVYAQEIVGVDLRTGQPAWAPIPMPNGAHVVGKSVRSDSKLIVPLSNQQLIEIDLLQGSVLSETRCEKALGNLAVVDNRLLSASPFELTSYSIRDRFQADLIAELKNAPGTASVLQKEGELALASGEIDNAMAKLEEAIALSPQDFDIRRSFIKALTMALRTDFDRYIEKVRSYESIASDLDLPTYLRVMIHGLEKRERWSEAFEKLLELSDTRLSRRIDQMMDGNSIDASARWTIHEDAWISAHLARIARRLSDSEWESLRVAIEKRLVVDPKQDPSMIRLRLQHFDGLPYTQTARLKYASSLGVRSMVDAEYLLTSSGALEKPLDEADQTIRKAKARLYLKSERPMKSWLELGKDDERQKRTGNS